MQLLEREKPLQVLEAALAAAMGGQGRLALVSGEAGIGKTALVEQFTRAHQQTVRSLWGACDALFTPRPLGPLLDMAGQLEGDLPTLLPANLDRSALFSAFLAELQRQPTIAVFEDLQWADEATLDLIKFAARRVHRTASLVIGTYRDDELGAGHPLRLVLGDLPRAAMDRLELLPLSKAAVQTLASAADQAALSNALFATTSGNPFFVGEILENRGEAMPANVRDAVLTRAARLSPAARAVLEAAAIIGPRSEPWLLAQVAGAQAVELEACLSSGLLQTQGDLYAFRHELTRQAILATILPERRLELHRITLALLRDSAQTNQDLARLANHAEGTRDVSAVLAYAPAAARQAAAASSHREAIALFELVLRFADSLPPASRAQVLEDLTNELWFANRVADSIGLLKQAIELRHALGEPVRTGLNLVDLAEVYCSAGRMPEAEQTSAQAIAQLEALPPSPELAQAYRVQCFLRMEDRDLAEGVRWGEKAIALAEQFGDLETIARACNYAGCSLLVLDYERGRALMERSLQIGRAANLPWVIAGTLANLAQTLGELYQFEAAADHLSEGIAYATEHDDEYHLQEMLTWQALARLHQGQWAEAGETLANVLARPNRDLLTDIYARLALGRLRVRQGDPGALALLDEGLALSAQVGVMRLEYARAARAELHWLAGEHDRAMEEARAGYERAASKEHPWVVGELAFWRWRAGDRLSPPAWIAKPFALQIAGDWRGAAREWEARNCPYEQALALMDGDAPAQTAALEIFERLGAAPAAETVKQTMRAQGVRGAARGPRPATRKNSFGLTGRELEVLGCLVQGSSNKAMAEKLSLSTRTIEHHVASILRKMDVQSRGEAIALAMKHHLFLPD